MEKDEFVIKILKTYDSMNEEINKAGGVGLSSGRLLEMGAIDLLIILGANDIHFNYKGSNEVEDPVDGVDKLKED